MSVSEKLDLPLREIEKQILQVLADPVTDDTIDYLNQLANAMVQTEDADWQHIACHLFQNYDVTNKHSSLLQNQKFLPAAELLVAKAVALGADDPCFARILCPVAKYNIDQMILCGIETEFPFKPLALMDEKIMVLAPSEKEHPLDRLWRVFAQSQTPEDFFTALTTSNIYGATASSREGVASVPIETICRLVWKIRGQDGLEEFLGQMNLTDAAGGPLAGDIDMETLIEKAAALDEAARQKAMQNIMPGVFVDVEGTLIQDRRLNHDLVRRLEYLAEKNVPIVIFTDGTIPSLIEQLKSLGFDTEKFPVRAKSEFSGKCCEYLVDDTHPSKQRFDAVHYIDPRGHADNQYRDLDEAFAIPKSVQNGFVVTPKGSGMKMNLLQPTLG